jgi:hypothetical protein
MAFDPFVEEFLTQIEQRLDMAVLIPTETVDVWSIASRIWPQSDQTIKKLAILFQDLSRNRLHGQWLTSLPDPRVARFGHRLLQIIDSLMYFFKNSPDRLSFFPAHVKLHAEDAYHFYVIAMFTDELSKFTRDAQIPASYARTVAFFFNYVYEEQAGDKNPRWAVAVGTKKTFGPGTLRDMYAGYLATRWRDGKFFSFEEFNFGINFRRTEFLKILSR